MSAWRVELARSVGAQPTATWPNRNAGVLNLSITGRPNGHISLSGASRACQQRPQHGGR